MQLLALHVPNLNMLGTREPGIYGSQTLGQVNAELESRAQALGAAISCYQSNHEGALVDRIHEGRGSVDGILINAGAYTHSSIALRDAVATLTSPIIEVHLSHTYARESFRRASLLAPYTRGTISGLGWMGYRLAIEGLVGEVG